jgi:DNA-binding transcriptional regulator GbsR (MarR family)
MSREGCSCDEGQPFHHLISYCFEELGGSFMCLRESGEMYIETILVLSEREEPVRSLDVANHLGFSKPSVSRAMGKLKSEEYINIDKQG